MKTKLIQILSLLLFASLCSCKDFLEEVPRNSTHVGEFWQSADDVSSAVAGNYALLRDAVTSGNASNVPRYYLYGDGVPASYFEIQYSGDGLEGVQTGDFTWRYTIESYGDWTKYYKAIAMSNLILEKVSAMDVESFTQVNNPMRFKNEALGQAYFIRALCYFMLTRVWGDVPLVLHSEEDPIGAQQLGRRPKSEILSQVEGDCHRAAGLLDWSYSSQGAAKVTANKGAVYALLAHMYLWRATTTELASAEPIMSDVNSADSTIAAIKSFGGYAQVDTANYYRTFIGKSSDGIFEIAASEEHLEGSSTHIGMFFLREAHVPFYSATYSRFFVKPTYLSQHYKPMPTGPEDWVWVDGHWWWNEPAWRWDWIEGQWVLQQVMNDRVTDVRYLKNFTDLGGSQPTCIKYHNVVPITQNSVRLSNNLIIFRYSDMLLLEAEIALYKNNLQKAADIINGFRERNDPYAKWSPIDWTTTTKDNLMYEYVIERGRELYLEGHNYYDLIRTRQYPQFITWLSPARFVQGGFYWPVSPNLFKNNPNLTQTSYWIGKI
ncbi:MAG TPA: RagB/SusD family nutrient uptake outer membrane protein [Sphingobacterium sp.]|nr:RagB/SusD family nutrient uptake outer membrane protein [Sphingobacterium sp.]